MDLGQERRVTDTSAQARVWRLDCNSRRLGKLHGLRPTARCYLALRSIVHLATYLLVSGEPVVFVHL